MAPKKTQKMSLGDFLGDQSLGSWADEMEDMPMPSDSRTGYSARSTSTAGGWGGERSGGFERSGSGYPPREQLPLPNKPPYTAHLGNLSFDATEGDIQDFFSACSVTNVRIVEDKLERKPKGFGYVEFATLEGLKTALDLGGTQFQGRNIKISVAEPPKERTDRDITDWTRKGPLGPPPESERRTSENRGYGRFDGTRTGDDGDRGKPARDFDWGRPRGPPAPLPEQDNSRARGNRPPPERQDRPERADRPERPERQERQPTPSERETTWRKPAATPDVSTPSSPAAAPAAPAMRPKLNLQKRTVSEAEPSPASAASDAKASPFGAARPIDTAAREKEIEEKRQIALQQKKEADDKAREEKRAKEAAAKTEREKSAAASADDSKDGAETKDSAKPGKSFEILQRANDENADTDDDAEDQANGNVAEEKAAKPKEVTRDTRKPSGGPASWRKPAPPADAPAETLDADGWSTVPNPRSRGSRRGGGNQGSRVTAS